MRTHQKAVSVVAAALLVGVGTVAHADNAVADGDGLVPVSASTMSFGDVACNETVTKDALVAVTRQGATNNNTYGNNALVSVAVTSVSHAAVQAAAPAGTITLPGNWTTIGNNVESSAVASTVSLTPTAEGTGTATVTYSAAGAGALGWIGASVVTGHFLRQTRPTDT